MSGMKITSLISSLIRFKIISIIKTRACIPLKMIHNWHMCLSLAQFSILIKIDILIFLYSLPKHVHTLT